MTVFSSWVSTLMDMTGPAQRFDQINGGFGESPASCRFTEGHAVDHGIGAVRFPRAFYCLVRRLLTGHNAAVADKLLFMDKGVSDLLSNILQNGLPRRIIRAPLLKAQRSMIISRVLDTLIAAFGLVWFCFSQLHCHQILSVY